MFAKVKSDSVFDLVPQSDLLRVDYEPKQLGQLFRIDYPLKLLLKFEEPMADYLSGAALILSKLNELIYLEDLTEPRAQLAFLPASNKKIYSKNVQTYSNDQTTLVATFSPGILSKSTCYAVRINPELSSD